MKTRGNTEIIGKYLVKGGYHLSYYTDNPREAVWEANRIDNSSITNICGDRDFYKGDDGKWHSKLICND